MTSDYAWSLVTRKRYAHLLGVILSTAGIVLQTLYFLTQVVQESKDITINKKSNPFIGFLFFIFFVLARVIFPIIVFFVEYRRGVGLSFNHEELETRLKKSKDDKDVFTLAAAQMLFNSPSSEDFASVNFQKGKGGGVLRNRKQTGLPPRSSGPGLDVHDWDDENPNATGSDAGSEGGWKIGERPATPFRRASEDLEYDEEVGSESDNNSTALTNWEGGARL